jgi:ABC-type Fe3+/spermidine/putrescine transport system ATPase subunit
VVRRDGGWANAPAAAAGATRAHFRGDRARLVDAGAGAEAGALVLDGVVAQRVYLGNAYRYRIRAGNDEVWVEDAVPRDEGAAVRVAVGPDSLLLFH